MIELKQVLQQLQEANLCAKPSKCKIAMAVAEFVGHNVGNDGIRPREALVKAIENFPRPESKTQ